MLEDEGLKVEDGLITETLKGHVSLLTLISRLDIVEIVSEFIKVERRGKRVLAICPFHDDNDPSLLIDPERQLYYCFPCQNGGNLVTFLQRFNNWSLVKVRAWLIERLGIVDSNSTFKKTHINRPKFNYTPAQLEIIGFNKRLESALQLLLLERKDSDQRLQCFLKERAIDFEDLANFKLGYLPEDSIKILNERGFSSEELITFGLLAQLKLSGFLPRLVFPIRREGEEVVGFVFRSVEQEINIGEDGNKRSLLARYINSSEDALFKKRENLYNMEKITRGLVNETIFLVEGIFDVIALSKVGLSHSVALLGLNLSDEQLTLLNSFELVLALDNDDAGREASLKIAMKLLKNKIAFKILRPGIGLPKDWDEWLRIKGKDSLTKHLRDQLSISDYLYRILTLSEPASPSDFSGIMATFKSFLPFINPLEAQWLSARFASHFAVSRSLIEDNLDVPDRISSSSSNQRVGRRVLKERGVLRQRGFKVTGRLNRRYQFNSSSKLYPSQSKAYWEDKLSFWEKRILKALLKSEELRGYFKDNYIPKQCFQTELSLNFWEQRLSGEEKINREDLPPELIEFEGELNLIRDFPDTTSRLDELLTNLNLPVAYHLTKKKEV